MENGRRTNILNRDYRLISSYLSRWATVIVFSAIIALAVGALFLKSDDMAHMPIVIGVCTFDSARAGPALESVRRVLPRQGVRGHPLAVPSRRTEALRVRFLSHDVARAFRAARARRCSDARSSPPNGRRTATRGASVLVQRGRHGAPRAGRAHHFRLSPLRPRAFSPRTARSSDRGMPSPRRSIDFAGSYPGEERVVFGVLYGAYDAGGISLERLQALEEAGIVRDGELDVLCEGEAFPEIVIAYDPASYTPDRKSFARRLPGVFDRVPAFPAQRALRARNRRFLCAPRERSRAHREARRR